jgi:hypothetical protein
MAIMTTYSETKWNWLLPVISVVGTLLIALLLLRWLTPQLIGLPVNLQMVQVAEQKPAFFDNVFRDEDFRSRLYNISDPYVTRGRPLTSDEGWRAGPHDLLGFRNYSIPNRPDIVVIGDSQTYGTNAMLVDNWPSRLAFAMKEQYVDVYGMAVNGWGPVEYLEIFPRALHFRPRLVVVAFYTGNDPLEGYKLAYAHDRWTDLRPDSELGPEDMPTVVFPPPESETWEVKFKDGLRTSFSPKYRLVSNRSHPVVRAGYAIMVEVARRMGEMAASAQVELVFTIIPTKEFVYAEKVAGDGLETPSDYRELVTEERRRIEELSSALKAIDGASYVDLVAPLQSVALGKGAIYPANINGHPIKSGYAVIANVIAPVAARELPIRKAEQVAVQQQFRIAFELQKAGLRGESIRLYEQVLAVQPSHEQAGFNLAFTLIQNETGLRRAVSLLELLADRKLKQDRALFYLGKAHEHLGEANEAAEAYKRFLTGQAHPALARLARAWLTENGYLEETDTPLSKDVSISE